MRYRVELTARAIRDLRRIYRTINAQESRQAATWFNRMEAVILSLDQRPTRGAMTPENGALRHLLYGRKPHVYRIIYAADEPNGTVRVLHIRYGARDAFTSERKPT
jgi:plasmid stabilization system protein ParE